MRRHGNQLDKSFKENKYDQFTNLGIDLETSLNKSIILPKIYNKIAEIQASEYVRQRRMREDRDMNQLKGEIDRLRRKICLIDDRKMVHRLKTEDQDHLSPENQKLHRFKQSVYLGSNDSNRNSLEVPILSRYQRNTDKDVFRRQESNSIFMDKSQVKLTNSIIQIQNRQSQKNDSAKIMDEKISHHIDEAKGKNKKNIKSNGRLKRKFRIMAYVVYFSLFLPNFAKKHYHNRIKLLMQEYPHQVEKYYKLKAQVTCGKFKLDEAKLWNFFDDKLNILEAVQKSNLLNCFNHGQQVKVIKQHFQFLINNELNSSQKQFKEQLTYQQQMMFPKNIQFLLHGFETILSKFIETFTSFITKTDFFSQRWKTFSLGIMNNAFIHNSHPKLPSKIIQTGIIRLHPFKQVLLVYDQQTQCILLCYDIMCRIFAYKWMSRLQKLKKQPESSDQVTIIASFMITIFYLVCQGLLNDHLKTFLNENEDLSTIVKNRNKYIRPIIPLLIKSTRKRDEKLLNTNRLISNPPLQTQALQVISNNPAFVLNIQGKLKTIGYTIFQKLKVKMKEENLLIKSQTLNERNIFSKQRNKNEKDVKEIKQVEEKSNASSISIEKRLKVKPKK